MNCNSIKQQPDYLHTINLIQKVLQTTGPNGSIAFGKIYALKYLNLFNEMLNDEEINQRILKDVLDGVDNDLSDVRRDCSRRVPTPFSETNDRMMSMIADFVKSL
jgi:hypothetical protein